MQGLGSVQNFLDTYLLFLQVSPLAMTRRVDLRSEAPRAARAVGTTGCKPMAQVYIGATAAGHRRWEKLANLCLLES